MTFFVFHTINYDSDKKIPLKYFTFFDYFLYLLHINKIPHCGVRLGWLESYSASAFSRNIVTVKGQICYYQFLC